MSYQWRPNEFYLSYVNYNNSNQAMSLTIKSISTGITIPTGDDIPAPGNTLSPPGSDIYNAFDEMVFSINRGSPGSRTLVSRVTVDTDTLDNVNFSDNRTFQLSFILRDHPNAIDPSNVLVGQADTQLPVPTDSRSSDAYFISLIRGGIGDPPFSPPKKNESSARDYHMPGPAPADFQRVKIRVPADRVYLSEAYRSPKFRHLYTYDNFLATLSFGQDYTKDSYGAYRPPDDTFFYDPGLGMLLALRGYNNELAGTVRDRHYLGIFFNLIIDLYWRRSNSSHMQKLGTLTGNLETLFLKPTVDGYQAPDPSINKYNTLFNEVDIAGCLIKLGGYGSKPAYVGDTLPSYRTDPGPGDPLDSPHLPYPTWFGQTGYIWCRFREGHGFNYPVGAYIREPEHLPRNAHEDEYDGFFPDLDYVFYLQSFVASTKTYTFRSLRGYHWEGLTTDGVTDAAKGVTTVEELRIDFYRRSAAGGESSHVGSFVPSESDSITDLDITSGISNYHDPDTQKDVAQFKLDLTSSTPMIIGLPTEDYTASGKPRFSLDYPFYWCRLDRGNPDDDFGFHLPDQITLTQPYIAPKYPPPVTPTPGTPTPVVPTTPTTPTPSTRPSGGTHDPIIAVPPDVPIASLATVRPLTEEEETSIYGEKPPSLISRGLLEVSNRIWRANATPILLARRGNLTLPRVIQHSVLYRLFKYHVGQRVLGIFPYRSTVGGGRDPLGIGGRLLMDNLFYLYTVNSATKNYTFVAVGSLAWELTSPSLGKSSVDDLDLDFYHGNTYVGSVTTTVNNLRSSSRIYNNHGHAHIDLNFSADTPLIGGLPTMAFSQSGTPENESQAGFYWIRFRRLARFGSTLRGSVKLGDPPTTVTGGQLNIISRGQEFRFNIAPHQPFFVTKAITQLDYLRSDPLSIEFVPGLPSSIVEKINDTIPDDLVVDPHLHNSPRNQNIHVPSGTTPVYIRWVADALGFDIPLLAFLEADDNSEFSAKVRYKDLRDSLHQLSTDDLAVVPSINQKQIMSLLNWSFAIYDGKPIIADLRLVATTSVISNVIDREHIPVEKAYLESIEVATDDTHGYSGHIFTWRPLTDQYVFPFQDVYYGRRSVERIRGITDLEVMFKRTAGDTLAKVADIDLSVADLIVGDEDGLRGWVLLSNNILRFSVRLNSVFTGLPSVPYQSNRSEPPIVGGAEGFYWWKTPTGQGVLR